MVLNLEIMCKSGADLIRKGSAGLGRVWDSAFLTSSRCGIAQRVQGLCKILQELSGGWQEFEVQVQWEIRWHEWNLGLCPLALSFLRFQ